MDEEVFWCRRPANNENSKGDSSRTGAQRRSARGFVERQGAIAIPAQAAIGEDVEQAIVEDAGAIATAQGNVPGQASAAVEDQRATIEVLVVGHNRQAALDNGLPHAGHVPTSLMIYGALTEIFRPVGAREYGIAFVEDRAIDVERRRRRAEILL